MTVERLGVVAAIVTPLVGAILVALVWVLCAKFADAKETDTHFNKIEVRQAAADQKLEDVHEWVRLLAEHHGIAAHPQRLK